MALTPEVIKANEALANLTDEQLSAITSLSKNDEDQVINTKIGELHGRYDQDVLEVTGIEKAQGEKTYDYVKRVLGKYKDKTGNLPELQTKVSEYEKEIQTLKTQISEGKGDDTIRKQLKDAQTELESLRGQYNTEKESWTAKEKDFAQKITQIQVNSQFEKATAGLKFKAEYPKSVQDTLLESAKNRILNQYKPDWIESDGKKIMVFRDEKGEIVRNKSNSLNPYTAEELINTQLKDVIDPGRRKEGAGTKKPNPEQPTVELVDLAGAKNQVEADSIIVKYLLQNGETRGSGAFAEKQKKLREENGVNDLPIR